jgi:lysophospholipase L1-like esterase
VVLDADDIGTTGTTNKFVTSAEKTKLSNLSGTNTGDQDLSGLVPNTRTVNTKALSSNVTLTQDDVGDGTTYKQYSSTEKTKLSGIATGATANSSDATLLNRANHTGVQAQSTVTNLTTDLAAKAPLASPTFTGTVSGVTKSMVGLGNVTNDAQLKAADLDVDGTLAANSDTKVASQKAVKTYVDKPYLYETVNQNTTLKTFGDSITEGYYASTTANRYANLVATRKGWTLTNVGSSGKRMNDAEILDAMYAETVTSAKNYSLMIGTNDAQASGSNEAKLDNFRGCLAAGIAWLAIPDTAKVKPSAATKTGTWTANTVYGGLDYYSNTNGSTMSATVRGNVVYVGYTRTTSDTGTFSVTIDGALVGTFGTQNTSIVTRADSGQYGAYLLRFPNLANGAHAVTITVTSSTATGNKVFMDWIAGNGFPEEIGGPNVWLANTTRATDAYYAAHSPFTDAAVAAYNSMTAEVATSLSSDGLNVCFVDLMAAVDRSTDLYTDGLHPSDTGHAKIADAFVAQMSSFVKPRDRAAALQVNTPWFTPTLNNTWVAFSANFDTFGYMKDAMGFVHLRGLIKSGTAGSGNAIVTLPVGFRPSRRKYISTVSNSAFGVVEIFEDGTIYLSTGTNAFVSFDNITFLADK